MITRKQVSEKLLAYLNGEITLAQLVDWSEKCFVSGGLEPEQDVELLADILMYLAAADTKSFPLTWEICAEFMKRLGTPIKVINAAADREEVGGKGWEALSGGEGGCHPPLPVTVARVQVIGGRRG